MGGTVCQPSSHASHTVSPYSFCFFLPTHCLSCLTGPALCLPACSGHGAFHHACMGGDLQLVEALTSRGGAGMPDLTGHEGGKLLNLACAAGHASIAQWLLKNKVGKAGWADWGRGRVLLIKVFSAEFCNI